MTRRVLGCIAFLGTSRSLSDIICDNTDVQDVPKKAMQPSTLLVMSCVDAVGLDFDAIAADISKHEPGNILEFENHYINDSDWGVLLVGGWRWQKLSSAELFP